jgi:chromosomal replication initiator protein
MTQYYTAESSLWQVLLKDLKDHIEPGQYHEFLDGTFQESFDDGVLKVAVPSAFHRSWLDSNIRSLLNNLVADKGDDSVVGVEFTVRDDLRRDRTRMRRVYSELSDRPPSDELEQIAQNGRTRNRVETSLDSQIARRTLNPKYTFDNFVVGENCRFACAAAQKLSDPESKAYNPLFIYGGVGLGKTHLLHAIGHQFIEKRKNARVVYVNSEEFMTDFVEALTHGNQMSFRNLYRGADLLLVDDVQFFTGKKQTQEEFFHTFNRLHEAGKKIVLSSDKQPKELEPLEERLRSRFEWGLLVDIQVPDLETRMAILKKKAEFEKIHLPQEVIFYIAEHIQSNVRELEGALLRLKAYSAMQGRPIDLQMCGDLLGHLIFSPDTADRNSVEIIQEAVANYFDITPKDLIGRSRQKRVAIPRHVAQYLCRKLTGLSYPEIGSKFGGRDHTSVLHAFKKIEREVVTDARLANCVNYIMKKVRDGNDTPSSQG